MTQSKIEFSCQNPENFSLLPKTIRFAKQVFVNIVSSTLCVLYLKYINFQPFLGVFVVYMYLLLSCQNVYLMTARYLFHRFIAFLSRRRR